MTLIKVDPKDFVAQQPTYPDFPYAEYKSRLDRARELMRENEIDCLMLWKREDVRYYFGYLSTHWEICVPHPAVGIIPLDKDPILITNTVTVVNAQLTTWVRDLRYLPAAHEYRQQRVLSKDVAAVCKEIGCANKTIGLEMGPDTVGSLWIPRPYDDIQRMMAELPDAKWVSGEKVIWGCRVIKSPLEIERMRKACAVLKDCYSAVVEQFRPGMTEMDIAKMIHHIEVDSGDFQGGDTVICHMITCNLEKEGVADCLAFDDVTITKDDYLTLDLQHRHKGYWADMARVFQVGPITGKMKESYKLIEECVLHAEEMLKPGSIISEIFKYGYEPVVKAGLAPIDLIGHGIGMDIHEPPNMDIDTHEPLQKGMTLSVEVWTWEDLRRTGGAGMFAIEDQYVITDKGFEKLPSISWDIIQTAHPFE